MMMVLLLVALSTLFLTFSPQAAEEVAGKNYYTAFNVWYDKGSIESTNYHKGVIIPLGTRVTITEVDDGFRRERNALEPQVEQEPFIRFDGEGGQPYRIVFKRKHAKSGMTVWDLFKQYFSLTDPKGEGGTFRSLTAEEQKSVMAGEIMNGMSKAAVIMAYGYPPSHKTPSLDSNTWIYWEGRKTRTVGFVDGRVTDDSGPGDTKKRKKEKRERKTSSLTECIEACKENTHRTPEQCFDACNR
jgi:hypothetical protein